MRCIENARTRGALIPALSRQSLNRITFLNTAWVVLVIDFSQIGTHPHVRNRKLVYDHTQNLYSGPPASSQMHR